MAGSAACQTSRPRVRRARTARSSGASREMYSDFAATFMSAVASPGDAIRFTTIATESYRSEAQKGEEVVTVGET